MRSLLLAPLLVFATPQDRADSDTPPSRTIGEHGGTVVRIAPSPDGETLVTAGGKEIHAYDLETGERRWSAPTPVEPEALSVGDELVAWHPGMAVVSLLSLKDGAERTGIAGTTAGLPSRCLAIDPGDKWIWVGTDQGVVSRVIPDQVNSWSNRSLKNGGATCLAMDAKGKTLAVGGVDGTVRFVGAKSASVDDKIVCEGDGEVTALAIDDKGSVVVAGSKNGAVRVFKTSNGKELKALDGHEAAITAVAVDPKGARCATGDARGIVYVWDAKKGERELELPKRDGEVTGLAFVDKGKTLAVSGGASSVTLFDLSGL